MLAGVCWDGFCFWSGRTVLKEWCTGKWTCFQEQLKAILYWNQTQKQSLSWSYLLRGFCLSWAGVEKALFIARQWEKPCEAEPWHTSAASSFLGKLLTSKTKIEWIKLNSLLSSTSLSSYTYPLVSLKQQSQVFACLHLLFRYSLLLNHSIYVSMEHLIFFRLK